MCEFLNAVVSIFRAKAVKAGWCDSALKQVRSCLMCCCQLIFNTFNCVAGLLYLTQNLLVGVGGGWRGRYQGGRGGAGVLL